MRNAIEPLEHFHLQLQCLSSCHHKLILISGLHLIIRQPSDEMVTEFRNIVLYFEMLVIPK